MHQCSWHSPVPLRTPGKRVGKRVELNFAARPPPRLKRSAEIQFDPPFSVIQLCKPDPRVLTCAVAAIALGQ